jgi:hypothetical protein
VKLLDTSNSNHKIKKSQLSRVAVRIASLSLYPDDLLCPQRHNADCANPCIVGSGCGAMGNVIAGRKNKTEFYHADRAAFIEQLKRELTNFWKLCSRHNIRGYVRLNTFSDIQWERPENGSIPQSFPELTLYDYTKLASRLDRVPDNYKLMFSYSAAPKYQNQVRRALKSDRPISVVFNGPMPDRFLDRPVINGDDSDLNNLDHIGHIVGLRFKQNRIAPIDPVKSHLVITTDRSI